MSDGERSGREMDHLTLADVGEGGLLRRIFPLLPGGDHTVLGPGDDTAVVRAPDGRVVATTDLIVEGRDFRHDWSSPQDVGVKAAAQNLADVAAMGAVPTSLLVGLVAPADLPVDWAVGLSEGLALGCVGTGAGVVGGDLSSGPVVVVAVTALGDLEGRPPVLRSGARPGDVVAVAGSLGRSAAGLAVLQSGWPDAGPLAGAELTGSSAAEVDTWARAVVRTHRRPEPPYAAGPEAARAGATAMLDVSDGLLRDAGRVADASGVCLDLDDAALGGRFVEPLRSLSDALGADPWTWVLTGGEDHGLLATFPSGSVPASFTVIGSVRPRLEGGPDVLLDGHAPSSVVPGWDHFRP
ncbi:MAG TPA: thiamine-phosphate kinase [Actinomycetales bacterium]|nr:thiamine-phosphate kinase [Actinomycetales bacterium]